MSSKTDFNPRTACVLTTSERADVFRAAVGPEADFKLNPMQTFSLADFLYNFQIAGGQTAILDEAHFLTSDILSSGLQQFLDSGDFNQERLRLIVVCSRRKPSASMLSFLVAYCGIYDVIYDTDGPELTLALKKLLRRRNERGDVLELVTAAWEGRNLGQGALHKVEVPASIDAPSSQSFIVTVSIEPCSA